MYKNKYMCMYKTNFVLTYEFIYLLLIICMFFKYLFNTYFIIVISD